MYIYEYIFVYIYCIFFISCHITMNLLYIQLSNWAFLFQFLIQAFTLYCKKHNSWYINALTASCSHKLRLICNFSSPIKMNLLWKKHRLLCIDTFATKPYLHHNTCIHLHVIIVLSYMFCVRFSSYSCVSVSWLDFLIYIIWNS